MSYIKKEHISAYLGHGGRSIVYRCRVEYNSDVNNEISEGLQNESNKLARFINEELIKDLLEVKLINRQNDNLSHIRIADRIDMIIKRLEIVE